jgi:sugar transferase (PEP-CTERM system associated)
MRPSAASRPWHDAPAFSPIARRDRLSDEAGTRVRRFQHNVLAPLLLLASLEAAAFTAAPMLAFAWLPDAFNSSVDATVGVGTFGATVFLGFTAMGLYSRRQRARLAGVLLRAEAAIIAGVIAIGLVSYFVPKLSMPRDVLALAAAIALAAAATTRIGFDRLADENIFKRRVLIYGAGRRAVSLSALRRRADLRGFSIVAFIRIDGERLMVPEDRAITLDVGLLEFCRQHEVDEVVVAMDDRRRAFPVDEFLECRLSGFEIIDIVDFFERETGKVRLDVLNPSWIIFSPGFDRSRWRETSKRALDVVASVTVLLVSLPAIALTALAIKLEDGLRAPILYRQRRVGLDGQVFNVLKFRSMRVDAEPPGTAVWAKQADSRVTRVGSFIRKVRIDELPQIFNVVRGEMSFVGPRPERPEFVAELENTIPYYRERHCVKPGITGWAQLCYPYGSSEHDAAEKLQYDLYYVKNHSLLFDVIILLQTAEVVLWGRGAR